MKITKLLAAFATAATFVALSPTLAHAEPASVSGQVCGTTGCVPIPPALAIAVIVAPVVVGNVQAAGNESGVGAQVLRATLGISVRDMEKYGFWGGPNSFFRCPLGGC
jgi:hypothetical protein